MGRFFLEFFDHASGLPVEVGHFYFSFVDVDGSETGTREIVGLAGTTSYHVTSTTELHTINVQEGILWKSTTVGDKTDNPTSLTNMTQVQKDRTVTAIYEHTHSFHAFAMVNNTFDPAECLNGFSRGINFAFRTALADETPATPNPKAVTTTTTTPPCLNLDFRNAYVRSSNLGGFGPDADGIRGLVIGGASSTEGEEILLHITAVGETYQPNDPTKNGLDDMFGRINGMCGTSVDLRFDLVRSSDGSPFVAERLCIEFSGIDAGVQGMCTESVAVGGFDGYFVTDTTALSSSISIVDGMTNFTAGAHGTGVDNPMDPHSMSQVQKDRTVGFEFESVSGFSARFSWGSGGIGGRNIFFSGVDEF